ncbi:hypothetical protein BDQ17DRAFT_32870 [Cyathus striatus]|nr:hypothetical protein BDQ17DRAFT_32870 [Cyathus striatus]
MMNAPLDGIQIVDNAESIRSAVQAIIDYPLAPQTKAIGNLHEMLDASYNQIIYFLTSYSDPRNPDGIPILTALLDTSFVSSVLMQRAHYHAVYSNSVFPPHGSTCQMDVVLGKLCALTLLVAGGQWLSVGENSPLHAHINFDYCSSVALFPGADI